VSDETFYKKGYELALDNAKRLSIVADKAYLEFAFGIACSLNILSAEEALKASFLIIKHHNPNGKINEFDKIFYKHNIKHEQLIDYVNFQTKLQVDISKYLKFYSPLVETLSSIKDSLPAHKVKEIKSVEENIAMLKRHSSFDLNLTGIIEWLKNANTNKNRGFYVDKVNNAWLTPEDISREKYEIEKEFTKALISYVESITQLYSMLDKIKNFS
jgi:AbiV family abortive infection protein